MLLKPLFFTAICSAVLVVSAAVSAQTIAAHAFSSGFGESRADGIILYSTIGQPVVGVAANDQYKITAGSFAQPLFYNAMVNEAPVITTNRDTLFPEEYEDFSVTLTASDPDNDSLAFSFPVLPSYITKNGAKLSWTAAKAQVDTFFKVVVSDGTLSDTFTMHIITVTHNVKPEITSKTEDASEEGALYTYTATGIDSENVALKFYFANYPAWMGDGSLKDGPTISGIVPEGVSTVQFMVMAEDDRWRDTAYVTISVKSVNNPPVLTSAFNIAATEDIELTYTALAFDPDNPALDIWYSDLPVNWKWSQNLDNGIITGAVLKGVPLDFAGTSCMLHVSDGANEDSMELFFSIVKVEENPVITSSPVVKIQVKEKKYYKATATDPENTPVTFKYEKVPAWCATIGVDSLEINATAFSAAVVDSFTLIARDNAGKEDTQVVVINAILHNAAPVITSASSANAQEDSVFTYVVTVSDSDDVVWAFSYPDLPGWLSRSGSSSVFSARDTLRGTPDGNVSIDKFKIVVSDGGDSPDTQLVIVDITIKNDPPKFISNPPLTVLFGEKWEYRVRATDPENNGFTFKLSKAPDSMTLNAATQQITWKPGMVPNDPVPVVIVVTDQHGDSSVQSFSLSVTVDGKPRCVIDSIPAASRGDISLPIKITDSDSSTVALSLYYYTSRGWEQISDAAISGKIKGINAAGYRDSIVWKSRVTLPEGKVTTKIRVLPSDAATGIEAVSNEFKIDNTAQMHFLSVSPAADTLQAAMKLKTIKIHYSGPKLDIKSIDAVSVTGSKGGAYKFTVELPKDSLCIITLDSFPVATEKVIVTLGKDIRDTTGKTLGEEFKVQYMVASSGDFNRDSTVDFDDLDEAAMFWHASASKNDSLLKTIINIGPAKGSAPEFRLTDTSSLFDFEDLSVFLSMWKYHHKGSGSKKTTVAFNNALLDGPLAKSAASAYGEAINKGSVLGAAQDNHVAITLSSAACKGKPCCLLSMTLNNLEQLVSGRIRLEYTSLQFGTIQKAEIPLFKKNSGEVIQMINQTSDGTELQFARFSAIDPGVDANEQAILAEIVLPFEGQYLESSQIKVSYEFVGTDHKTAAAGALMLSHGDFKVPASFSITGFIAGPNPARHGSRSVALSLSTPDAPLSPLAADGIMLQFTISIPEHFSASDKKVFCMIDIYDAVGNHIAGATNTNLLHGTNPIAGKQQYQTYWDCRTTNGFPVARGVYRAILSWKCGKDAGKDALMIGVR